MTKEVSFVDVMAQVAELGPLTTLITVTPEGLPHVGSVLVTAVDDEISVRVGRRTRDNLLARQNLTLTWLDPTRDYQLILDGAGYVGDEPDTDGLYPAIIVISSGILHRLAGRPDAGPSCKTLL
jgi:hypothetical protein